jgi:hypothetical protein
MHIDIRRSKRASEEHGIRITNGEAYGGEYAKYFKNPSHIIRSSYTAAAAAKATAAVQASET